MSIKLDKVYIENFKSYEQLTTIPISDLSVFMGANSSGKSTALQTLLAIKQTIECNSPDIDLLLSGKYISLGDFQDAINDLDKGYFKYGVSVIGVEKHESYGNSDNIDVFWTFGKEDELCLREIEFKVEGAGVRLIHKKDHLYDIVVNDRRIVLSVGLNNLKRTKLLVSYNQEFNDLFYNFLHELYQCFFPRKKVGFYEKNEFVTLKTLERFYFGLLQRLQNNSDDFEDDRKEQARRLADSVAKAIKEYADYQIENFNRFMQMPEVFRDNVLYTYILNCSEWDALNRIVEKYRAEYTRFTKENQEVKYDASDELRFESIDCFEGEKGDGTKEYDLVSEAFFFYNEILSKIIDQIFYVGPIREKPQGLYNIGFETIPKYVGITGAYFASVLLRENKEREYILPEGEVQTVTLIEALDEWVYHLSVASEIEVERKNSFGFSVSISNTQQKKSDIMNVGIGTSQVLPVLITGLLSEPGEYLLFEQPELHLHPYSQSRLADFFIELVRRGRKVIVETHSEHFLLRMRYQVLVRKISEKDIVINFFQNKNGTKISQGILSGYGSLVYPDDFRDETQKLLEDLMNAALERREK